MIPSTLGALGSRLESRLPYSNNLIHRMISQPVFIMDDSIMLS